MGTLALDASSPASVYDDTTNTVTTASFTPPAKSLLVVWLRYSTDSGETSLTAPTVTDNRVSHLTYAPHAHNQRPDINGASCGVAVWSAPVTTSVAMTVSTTQFAATLARFSALKVEVWTDSSGGTPSIGSVLKGASTSTSAIAAVLPTTVTGSRGVMGLTDGDAGSPPTAGTGCTVTGGDSDNPTFTMAYGVVLRSANDGVAGSTVTLNATLDPTTNARWVAVEILPSGTATVAGAGTVSAAARISAPATVAGAGSVSAAARITAPATVVGAGTTTATAVQQAGATVAGAGTVTAGVTITAGASVMGAGTVTAGIGGVTTAGATVMGAGTVSAVAVQGAGASVAGEGTVTAVGGVVIYGTATVMGAGSVSAVAQQRAGATVAGAGHVTAAATIAATASVVGAGHVTAVGGDNSNRIVRRPYTGTVTRP